MKRILLLLVSATMLLSLFGITACGANSSYAPDSLEEIKEYILNEKNYTVNRTYVTDKFIAWEFGSGNLNGVYVYKTDKIYSQSDGTTYIWRYDWSSYSPGLLGEQPYEVASIDDAYDKQGYAFPFRWEWVYNEKDKIYNCNGSTLQILGDKVVVNISEDAETYGGNTYEYSKFWSTEFELPSRIADKF